MKAKNRLVLQEKFGERVSFDKTEMLLYAHDQASLPGIIKRMIKTVPEAVVQPLDAEDVVFITQFARENSIPLTPRGAASSGWGGALPAKGGI
ncbi:FAD-binding oxidoreductase, partial [Chloroflexota bacterium]